MGERFVDTSKVFVVHPDMTRALQTYKPGDKTSIDILFDERNKIIAEGGHTHNDIHDAEFRETAEENTQNAIMQRGWKFPKRGKRG